MKKIMLAVSVAALVCSAISPAAYARGDGRSKGGGGGGGGVTHEGGASCVKKQMAKGRSECLAKAQCSGVTSRKQQAAMCG